MKNTEDDSRKNFLLIDDHEIVRSGVSNILSELFKPCQVYEAYNGASAVEQLKLRNYKLVIMDAQMPDTDSLGLIKFIRASSPETNVLIFSMSPENAYAKRFLKAGAMGYIPKDAGLGELKKAIDLAINNRKYISSKLAEQLINDIGRPVTDNPFDQLSKREFEIATLLIKGLTTKEICVILSLQVSTTGTYKSRIFEKLGVKNVLQLADINRLFNELQQ